MSGYHFFQRGGAGGHNFQLTDVMLVVDPFPYSMTVSCSHYIFLMLHHTFVRFGVNFDLSRVK